MDRLVRAFPVLPGKRDAFLAFAQEMLRRGGETTRFYDRYGIVRESWHFQRTSYGDLVIACTDITDLKPAAAAYAASDGAFETWFKGQVWELCGIDPNREPLGPECHTVFDWPPAS